MKGTETQFSRLRTALKEYCREHRGFRLPAVEQDSSGSLVILNKRLNIHSSCYELIELKRHSQQCVVTRIFSNGKRVEADGTYTRNKTGSIEIRCGSRSIVISYHKFPREHLAVKGVFYGKETR